jgi:hypothetical protein
MYYPSARAVQASLVVLNVYGRVKPKAAQLCRHHPDFLSVKETPQVKTWVKGLP